MNNFQYGYCHCGCGQKTTINPRDVKSRGYEKGKPKDFIVGHHNHNRKSKSIAELFWSKVAFTANPDKCWEWGGYKDANGYGRFSHKGLGKSSKLCHRVAWTLVYGEVLNNLFVCHDCDNPSCVNPNHLFLGTHTDNMRDMIKKGRGRKAIMTGEKNPAVKLTIEKVDSIRERYAGGGVSKAQLAREMGVDPKTIYNIVTNKKWVVRA